eukprot:COSAG04_NODE_653_length_11548_cov_2.616910_2_plen_320_part_00
MRQCRLITTLANASLGLRTDTASLLCQQWLVLARCWMGTATLISTSVPAALAGMAQHASTLQRTVACLWGTTPAFVQLASRTACAPATAGARWPNASISMVATVMPTLTSAPASRAATVPRAPTPTATRPFCWMPSSAPASTDMPMACARTTTFTSTRVSARHWQAEHAISTSTSAPAVPVRMEGSAPKGFRTGSVIVLQDGSGRHVNMPRALAQRRMLRNAIRTPRASISAMVSIRASVHVAGLATARSAWTWTSAPVAHASTAVCAPIPRSHPTVIRALARQALQTDCAPIIRSARFTTPRASARWAATVTLTWTSA